jgi:hypothetical protein
MNAEVLLGRLTVKDGRMTLPEGASYRALVLPPGDAMSPAVLRKLRDLVEGGATVVGPRPSRAPGLAGYPQSDDEVKKVAAELWGNCERDACEHRFGRGRVVVNKPLGDVLAGDGVPPDFEVSGRPDARFVYLHRRAGNADIYFVSNQRDRAEQVSIAFRTAEKAPELWDPDSGRMTAASVYQSGSGRTTVPLQLDPAGSVFVVFRRPAKGPTVVDVMRDGSSILAASASDPEPVADVASSGGHTKLIAWRPGSYELRGDNRVARARVDAVPEPLAIEGPWQVQFQPGRGAPAGVKLDKLASWTEHADDGVRHFSGTATYTTTVDVPAALRAGTRLVLDLGAVKELAEVSVNGKPVAVLWRPPFRADVTERLHAGKNRLEVKVTNLWPNRMIGDAAKPEAERLTWSTYQPFKADSPLVPSGLLGPVRIVAGKVADAR